ncbi:MAG: hypothetical protein IT370_11750 [Deltaproteobacteria bacterium]|nr:hypothetical protein [Deltaproteobacteria bacterium]
MAFDISSVDGTMMVSIAARDEHIVFELPAQLTVVAPRLAELGQHFYDSFRVAPENVPALATEIDLLRTAYLRQRGEVVAREKKVHARDPAVRARMIEGLLAADPTLGKLLELAALCQRAAALGEELLCEGD